MSRYRFAAGTAAVAIALMVSCSSPQQPSNQTTTTTTSTTSTTTTTTTTPAAPVQLAAGDWSYVIPDSTALQASTWCGIFTRSTSAAPRRVRINQNATALSGTQTFGFDASFLSLGTQPELVTVTRFGSDQGTGTIDANGVVNFSILRQPINLGDLRAQCIAALGLPQSTTFPSAVRIDITGTAPAGATPSNRTRGLASPVTNGGAGWQQTDRRIVGFVERSGGRRRPP